MVPMQFNYLVPEGHLLYWWDGDPFPPVVRTGNGKLWKGCEPTDLWATLSNMLPCLSLRKVRGSGQ